MRRVIIFALIVGVSPVTAAKKKPGWLAAMTAGKPKTERATSHVKLDLFSYLREDGVIVTTPLRGPDGVLRLYIDNRDILDAVLPPLRLRGFDPRFLRVE